MARSFKSNTYTGLAVQLKEEMNSIIDTAYKGYNEAKVRQFKRFSIHCTDKELAHIWGDCYWNRETRTSSIRIVRMKYANFKDVLITTIHEVAHHVDFSLNGTSGHQAPFYDAFERLLFAAFDMGIISPTDVNEHNSRSKSKIMKRIASYTPNPVEYKKDLVKICAYNSFAVKGILKSREYRWNGADLSWSKEVHINDLEAEKKMLLSLGLSEEDLKVIEGAGVVSRARKIVRLYGVPYEQREIPKALGYKWVKKEAAWEKQIDDTLSMEERDELNKIPKIRIRIT